MTPPPRVPVVRCEDVTLERDGHAILEDISFTLQAGDFLGVVGPNGAGKTTLLRAVLGLLPVSAGRIEVLGQSAGGHHRDAQRIGYVPQRNQIPRSFPASVADVVLMGRLDAGWGLGSLRPDDRSEVRRSLELVGIGDLASRAVGRLSGGEQRRVVLAQALCASTRLLVLDEPTIGLDLPAEHEFYALLRRLQSELTLSVICVSHDLVALAGEADDLICINRRMHIHGNPEDVVHSHAIREAYSCEFDFLAGEIAHHERSGHGR
ncbi:MAG: metal ABC transporter ATP-binding protein [Myxococcota bacterium]